MNQAQSLIQHLKNQVNKPLELAISNTHTLEFRRVSSYSEWTVIKGVASNWVTMLKDGSLDTQEIAYSNMYHSLPMSELVIASTLGELCTGLITYDGSPTDKGTKSEWTKFNMLDLLLYGGPIFEVLTQSFWAEVSSSGTVNELAKLEELGNS